MFLEADDEFSFLRRVMCAIQWADTSQRSPLKSSTQGAKLLVQQSIDPIILSSGYIASLRLSCSLLPDLSFLRDSHFAIVHLEALSSTKHRHVQFSDHDGGILVASTIDSKL